MSGCSFADATTCTDTWFWSAINSASPRPHFAEYALAKSKVLDAGALKSILDGANNTVGVKLVGLAMNNLSAAEILPLLSVIGGDYSKLTQPNKRPTFANTHENLSLIARLEELGIVSSHSVDAEKQIIKVIMKPNW